MLNPPSREALERYFHLSDEDCEAIQVLRGNHQPALAGAIKRRQAADGASGAGQ